MSLESQVAALVTASNTLTNEVTGKQAAIDASVAAAVAAVPNLVANIYVDNVAGVDTNSGDINNPVKTIDEALTRTKPVTNIYLMAGQTYTLTKNNPLITGITLLISKYGTGAKPILTQNSFANSDGINQSVYGILINNSAIKIKDINIKTAINPSTKQKSWISNGLITLTGSQNMHIYLEGCDVLIQDFDFFPQSGGRNHTIFEMYFCTINRASPQGVLTLLCSFDSTSTGSIAQASTTLLGGLVWSDLVTGITKDANGALRNITTSIASL